MQIKIRTTGLNRTSFYFDSVKTRRYHWITRFVNAFTPSSHSVNGIKRHSCRTMFLYIVKFIVQCYQATWDIFGSKCYVVLSNYLVNAIQEQLWIVMFPCIANVIKRKTLIKTHLYTLRYVHIHGWSVL